jgi:hypothetical protein
MKMCLALCFVLPSFGLFAQKGIEKFPVFDACEAASAPIMEQCFYQTLYAQLRTNYEHPQELYATIADKRATLRFEVSKKGSFDLIHIDAMNPAVKVAMDASFKKLPVIQAPSYNGSPSFMQFVLTVPVPMSDDGAFQLSSNTIADNQQAKGRTNALDSLAFAKANNDYAKIVSNKYRNQELNSNALIPLSAQRYSVYEMAMNRIGNNAHTAVKPYTFSYVNEYYDLEAERSSQEKEVQTWLGRKWSNEHFFQVVDDNYWFVVDPGVDLQLGRDTREQINTSNNTRLVQVNGGIGKQLTFGASIQESQGIFAGYFNREITRRAPDGGNPGIVPGRGIAEDGGDKFDYPVATGYINYQPSNYFNLQLGHGQHFIGDGYRSLVLSDNSQPFPYAKVNAKFWKLDYTVLYTSLRDVRSEVTADDSFRTKFMVHHYLSWNATKKLNIGLFESVLWQNDNNRGFDFNYINPLIFYQAIELQTGSRGGNALLGATIKYKFTDRITGYGQLVLDEFSSAAVASGNGGYQNKSAYQLGLKWQNPFQVQGLSMQIEYNRVRPFTYSHNTVVLNYANSNQALAHPWGANFYEAMVIARYTKDRWYGIGKFIYGQRGFDKLDGTDNAFYGGDIYRSEDDRIADVGNTLAQGNTAAFFYGHLEVGYIINPASRLTFYGQAIYRDMDPVFDNAVVRDENTLWLNLGLRTDIFNWSFDR